MADLKISQLTGATTPLAGTEVLPIDQSGSTRKVSVANLTAGRTQTSNGIVQGTAGTGYNFTANTPAAGMTSQLLNWYEEGTWMPTDVSGAGLTFSVLYARYTRIGNLVTINCYLTFPVTASTAIVKITLPISSTNFVIGAAGSDSTSNVASILINGSATDFTVRNNQLATLTNANLSNRTLVFSATYPI